VNFMAGDTRPHLAGGPSGRTRDRGESLGTLPELGSFHLGMPGWPSMISVLSTNPIFFLPGDAWPHLCQVRRVDQKLTRSDDPAALSGRHDCNLSRVAVATKSGRTFMRHSLSLGVH